MWFYLFARNGKYPDPLLEIRALAELSNSGKDVYLKLSARNDAPLKNAKEGETVYLCTRVGGRWFVYGESVVAGLPQRGRVPESMRCLYASTDRQHWWRRLGPIHVHPNPKSEVDLGLVEGTLPAAGQAHVIRVQFPGTATEPSNGSQPTATPLARLTEVVDQAWDAGHLTPDAIKKAIKGFRKAHPYGR
jgi:hypothetical protein